MPKQVNYKNINVTGTTTGTIAFLTSLDISEYYVYGSSVLTGNLDLSAGGSEIDGMVIEIYYYASITPGAFNLSILGTAMPDHLCAIPQRIFAVYQSGWKVSFMPSFNQNSIIETFNIKDGAVQYDKILNNSVTINKLYDPGDGYMIRFTGSGGSYISPGSAGNILSWAGGTPLWLALSGDLTVAEGGSVTLSPNAVTLQKAHDGGYAIVTADGPTASPIVLTNNTTGTNQMMVYIFNNVGGTEITISDNNATGFLEANTTTKKTANGAYKSLTTSIGDMTDYIVDYVSTSIVNAQTGAGQFRTNYRGITTSATGNSALWTGYNSYDSISTANDNDNKFIDRYTVFVGSFNPSVQKELIGGMVDFRTITTNGKAELIGYRVDLINNNFDAGILKGFEITNYVSPANPVSGSSILAFRSQLAYSLDASVSGSRFIGVELSSNAASAVSNNSREYQIYSTSNSTNGDNSTSKKFLLYHSHALVNGSDAAVYGTYLRYSGNYNGANTLCSHLIDFDTVVFDDAAGYLYGIYLDATTLTVTNAVNANAIHLEEATGKGFINGFYAKKYRGNAIYIDNYSVSYGIDMRLSSTTTPLGMNIESSLSSADNIIGIRFNLANSGAGAEYAFSFAGSEIVAGAVGGSQDQKVRVKVGGTDYFIALNTA